MSMTAAQQYFVIPLSIQKEGDLYLIGNADMGDFYQFPEQGLRILNLLGSGNDPATIRSRLAEEYAEAVDVDDFVGQLSNIGFIHPADQRQAVQEHLQAAAEGQKRTFNVDPGLAKAIFSPPAMLCYFSVVLCASYGAVGNPELRINFNAFYIETNRTVLLLLVMALSFVQVAMHECGHMLAAARHGIKSKYGIGNRLWTVVAESDLTGILTLPKSQRYFPMLAGLLVDIVSASLLTIVIGYLLRHGVSAFTIQVLQALVLEIAISITWQFNIFVKTDIYYVLCNYFGYPDLDKSARAYLRDIAYHLTFGQFGGKAAATDLRNPAVLRVFSCIWLFGRVMSLLVLVGVFLPTMAQYIASAVHLLNGSSASIWVACDTIIYVSITLAMLSTGMYLWLKQR